MSELSREEYTKLVEWALEAAEQLDREWNSPGCFDILLDALHYLLKTACFAARAKAFSWRLFGLKWIRGTGTQ